MSNKAGKLYVVATPIGNLADFSPRAVDILTKVNLILAEDTRHSATLLHHFGIKTPCTALHEHNERDRVAWICDKLLAGEHIALISDAGTPLVSDPGFPLVKTVAQQGLTIIPIPGPCAATTALSVAGIPSDRFVFEGFLPPKTQQRKNHIATLKNEPRTLIFYESPHRLLDTLNDLVDVFGSEREVTLARELTKLHETVHKTTLGELVSFVKNDPNQQKGEIVLVVAGYIAAQDSIEPQVLTMLEVLLAELPLKQAVQIAARLTQQPRNQIYETALRIKGKAE